MCQIGVFISHSWKYSDNYDTLHEWIFGETWKTDTNDTVKFSNYSVPKDDPIHNAKTDKALKEAIYNKISRSNVIVIPTGMYASHSKWIQKEINGACEYKKPILAVNLRGKERSSSIVIQNSTKCVGWNKQSVIDGIWELYNIKF